MDRHEFVSEEGGISWWREITCEHGIMCSHLLWAGLFNDRSAKICLGPSTELHRQFEDVSL